MTTCINSGKYLLWWHWWRWDHHENNGWLLGGLKEIRSQKILCSLFTEKCKLCRYKWFVSKCAVWCDSFHPFVFLLQKRLENYVRKSLQISSSWTDYLYNTLITLSFIVNIMHVCMSCVKDFKRELHINIIENYGSCTIYVLLLLHTMVDY